MVDTRAKFHIPGFFGDDVEIQTSVTEVKRSSFSIEHRILKDGALAVEGWETRVWVGKDPADPDKIKSKPIPAEVVARLTQ
jgi:4-hydroxybenzoyl-CoA thioesterase